MKKGNLALIFFISLFLVLNIPYGRGEEAYASMQLSQHRVYLGEEFLVNVSLNGDFDTADINVSYAPIIQFVSINGNENITITQGSENYVFLFASGQAYATLKFKAVGIGNTTIQMHATINKNGNKSTYVEIENISILPPPNWLLFLPLNITKNMGEDFQVALNIDALQNWTDVAFEIRYNATIISLDNYSMENILNQSVSNISSDTQKGIIKCNLHTKGEVKGNSTILLLNFHGKKGGIASLSLANVSLKNENNTLIYGVKNGKVEIIGTRIYVSPSYELVYMGQNPSYLNTSIPIETFVKVKWLHIVIQFNTSILKAVSCENGGAFEVFSSIINNTMGEITLDGYYNFSNNNTFMGKGNIANITFSTIKAGETDIKIENVMLWNESLSNIFTHTENGMVEVRLDNTPPTTTLQHGTPYYNGYITSSTPLYINASDDASGVKEIHYSIDGAENIAYNNISFTIPTEGNHTIEYYSIDAVGNEEQHHIATYYVDDVAPTTTLQHGTPYYNGYITSSTPLYINASDEGAGIKEIHYIIDGVENVAYGNEVIFSLSGYSDGWHTIKYYSIDNLGNIESMHNISYYLDNSAPETSIVLNPSMPNGNNGWYISNVMINISSIDNGTGVNKIYYSIDEGEFEEYNATITISQDGIHEIKYYSVDYLGNAESKKSITIKIDKTKPSITIHGPSGTVDKSSVTFSWSVYDAISHIAGVYYKMDGGSWNPSTATGSKTFNLPDGTHTFYVRAYDNAGNMGTASKTFNIKTNKKPVAAFSYTPSQPYDTQSIKFDASASHDPDGSIANYTWQFGDGSLGYGKIVNHKYSDNGSYNVTLIVTDDDGATNSIMKIIDVKNEPPVADFTHTPKNPKVNQKIEFKAIGYDNDGSIVNYTWQFGDGSLGYGKIVNHTYSQEGTYEVKLKVTDNDGAVAEKTGKIVVKKELPNIWIPLTIIIILVIIAIALVAIWKKRTKS